MNDIEAIRERHRDCNENGCAVYVDPGQYTRHPCDTRIVLDALDAMTARVQDPCLERERDTARADADRLYWALMEERSPTRDEETAWSMGTEALRLHDEAIR